MSENRQYKDILIKVGICIVFALLYSLAGNGDFFGGLKWLRRIVAPLVLAGGVFYYSKDWKSLLIAPLLGIGFSCGYGHEQTVFKIIKRSYCGLIIGFGSSFRYLLNKQFLFSAFQTLIVTAFMIYLGVYNPLEARAEEFCLGFVVAFLPLMSARTYEKV